MLSLPGISDPLPAILVPLQRSREPKAWLNGEHQTVRLTDALPALRVHAQGSGAGAAANPDLVFGSGSVGRWFAIGDVILTRSEYTKAHALPTWFSFQDEWLLPAGTILNVGIAGPLFGFPGGALQAERLSGPPAQHRPVAGRWMDKSGNA